MTQRRKAGARKRAPVPPRKISLTADTAALQAVQARPDPVLLEVQREDLQYALAAMEAGADEPLRLLESAGLALQFWASCFEERPALRAVAAAFEAALKRYRTKEAPDLDRAFLMPPANGKRRRQAWDDRSIEFRGETWNAGTAAWLVYCEARDAGRNDTEAFAEITRALGVKPSAARAFIRELRAWLEETFPGGIGLPPVAYPGRPRKSAPRDS